MDILELLRAERDEVAQQVNALDTAISASQKARWARTRGKVVSIAPKRKISAAGLARIRAANRARWARVRAAKK